jgi:K+-transporting ATPase ATPase B chain
MTIKRGALTIFSLLSDISKYFVIVPALFVTSFPALEQLNFMEFKSIESVVLASITFNALVILAFIPILNNKNNWGKTNKSLWRYSIIFAISGLISPFIFIKLFEEIILFFGLISI